MLDKHRKWILLEHLNKCISTSSKLACYKKRWNRSQFLVVEDLLRKRYQHFVLSSRVTRVVNPFTWSEDTGKCKIFNRVVKIKYLNLRGENRSEYFRSLRRAQEKFNAQLIHVDNSSFSHKSVLAFPLPREVSELFGEDGWVYSLGRASFINKDDAMLCTTVLLSEHAEYVKSCEDMDSSNCLFYEQITNTM